MGAGPIAGSPASNGDAPANPQAADLLDQCAPSLDRAHVTRYARHRGSPLEREMVTVAETYFREAIWSLDRVLVWVARRDIDALQRTYYGVRSDLRAARIRALMSSDAVDKDPLAKLLADLRAGKIKGFIAAAPQPREFWDHYVNTPREDWPSVRFRREDVLKVYQALGSPPPRMVRPKPS